MKDICVNTGRPCSGCQPGACSFRQAHKFTIEQLLNHCSAVCEKEGLWGNVHGSIYREHDSVREYLNELQRYKDLEKNGRLIDWKRTTEELPNSTRHLIVADGEIISHYGYYLKPKDKWYKTWECKEEIAEPMYWADMPDPPKESLHGNCGA